MRTVKKAKGSQPQGPDKQDKDKLRQCDALRAVGQRRKRGPYPSNHPAMRYLLSWAMRLSKFLVPNVLIPDSDSSGSAGVHAVNSSRRTLRKKGMRESLEIIWFGTRNFDDDEMMPAGVIPHVCFLSPLQAAGIRRPLPICTQSADASIHYHSVA